MKLIRTVKVGAITNLSDARYCAGMGVQMMGFRVVENQPGFVSPETFHGIRGWFTGPAVVAEVYGLKDPQTMHDVLRNYLPDFVELSTNELPFMDIPSLALIVSANGLPADTLISRLAAVHNQVAYVLVEERTDISSVEKIAGHYPVLLRLDGPFTPSLLSLPVQGFALKGGPEEKPGLKSYDNLADVLEKLAED